MAGQSSPAAVVAVSLNAAHQFSKPVQKSIRLLTGLGVEGDAHLGVTVQHRSRVAKDPTQPNLRQVHLIHEELLDELNAAGFRVAPGAIGENITTRGINLLTLPRGARLHIGNAAIGPGGLKARLSRHMRRGKAVHWHVDQLTERGSVIDVWIFPGGDECDLVQMLSHLPVPIPGFGSSDCGTCRSHLLSWPTDMALPFNQVK